MRSAECTAYGMANLHCTSNEPITAIYDVCWCSMDCWRFTVVIRWQLAYIAFL